MKNKNKTVKSEESRGPGRPKYSPLIPRGKFTMRDLCELNGVDPETGKGDKCIKLTLVKYVREELSNRKSGMVVQTDETRPPQGGKLGRRQYVYLLRSKAEAHKAKKNVDTDIKDVTVPVVDITPENVTVDVSNATLDYEAQKAALLAPDAPIATLAPEEPITEPVTIPVADITPLAEPESVPVTVIAPEAVAS